MERNIMGELDMHRQLGTKPNFTDIARRYGMNRHTVAKYWKSGGDVGDGRSERGSGFDAVREVIEEKAALPGATVKGIHEYLSDRYGGLGLPGYTTLVYYMRKHDIVCGLPPQGAEPHPRFETPPGRQLQFDWKEDMAMHDRRGRLHEFNVFTATLGCSRLHRYRYSRTRTEDDTLRCLLSASVANGGFAETCVTDNMASLVTFSGGRRIKSQRALRFAREAGFELEFCRPRTPQTKGKDESANRFVNRLLAYEGDFEDEGELVGIISRIERRSNAEPNATTGVPPAVLFLREEKEALRPIGNLRHLEEMIGEVSVQTVPATMLVRHGGREWSVPRRCIGHRVKLLAMPGGQLVVSMGGEVVRVHDTTSARGPMVYDAADYAEALSCKARFEGADIEAAAQANLDLIERLGEAGR